MVTRKNALGTKKERIERFPAELRDKLPFQGRGRGMGRQKAPAWAQKK